MQLQSKIMRMLARGAAGPRVEIVRLDLGKIDHLNVAKKEYTETTFAQMREQMQQRHGAARAARSAARSRDPTPSVDRRFAVRVVRSQGGGEAHRRDAPTSPATMPSV